MQFLIVQKKIKEICWDPDIKILKRHLSNKILHKSFQILPESILIYKNVKILT